MKVRLRKWNIKCVGISSEVPAKHRPGVLRLLWGSFSYCLLSVTVILMLFEQCWQDSMCDDWLQLQQHLQQQQGTYSGFFDAALQTKALSRG